MAETNLAGLAQFAAAYAEHRAAEGRTLAEADLLALPYLRSGPLCAQWAVRARSFSAFMREVLQPEATRVTGPLTILDLGAGNGWLSYRVALEGHRAIALDIRNDDVDGLGAAEPYVERLPGRIERLAASFDSIPLGSYEVDISVFNASLHYATDLRHVLGEAWRVTRPGGLIAILDSPFYRSEAHGLEMVAEKRRTASEQFGARAGQLMALPFIEFLTRERLSNASAPFGLYWQRHRVLYPLAYELRPLRALLRRKRAPSRFDLWISRRR